MLTIMHGQYKKHDSLKTLKKVAVTPAKYGALERTARWKGIQHGELVEAILKAIDQLFGFQPGRQIYAVSPNQAALIGGVELLSDGSPLQMAGVPQDTNYAIGFKHSNDSKSALRIALGGSVTLCDNGMVCASEVWRRQHTNRLNLLDWLTSKLRGFMSRREYAGAAAASLSEFSVTKRLWNDLLLRLCREGVVSWHLGGEADRCWTLARDKDDPTWVDHERFPTASDRAKAWDFQASAWDAYNVVNHAIKQLGVSMQLDSLDRAFQFCLELLPVRKRPERPALET